MTKHVGPPTYVYWSAARRVWVGRFAYRCPECDRVLWPRKYSPYHEHSRDAYKAIGWAALWRQRWIREHKERHVTKARERAPRLWSAVRAYLTDKRTRGRSSWRIEASMCRRIFRRFGGITPIDRIKSHDVQRWRDDLIRNDLSPRTVNAYMALLAGIYHHANRLGADVSVPTRGIRRLDERKDRPPLTLSATQVRALFATLPAYERRQGPSMRAPSVPLRGLMLIAYYTLQREGSVFGVRWEDVNLDERLIVFPATKNWRHVGRVRVPIDGALLAYLQTHHPGPGASGYVHPNRAGQPYSDARKAWRTLIALTNIRLDRLARMRRRHGLSPLAEPIPPHFPLNNLRHTGASHLARSGAVSAQAVVEMMGDLSLATVERWYFNVGVEGVREDVRRARAHPELAAIERIAGR